LIDLKVLFVSPVFGINPYLGRISGLIIRMAKLVDKVKVITTVVEAGVPDEIELIRIPSLEVEKVSWPLPEPRRLLRTVREEEGKFDIKHFLKIDYPTSWGVLACRRGRILTVDNFPGIDYDHGDLFINSASLVYVFLSSKCLLRRFDGLISFSTISLATAERLGFRIRPREVIPLGVDTDMIKPDERLGAEVRERLGLDGPVALFVGRLSPVKGIRYLCRALEILDRAGLKLDVMVVGRGPEGYRLERLRTRVKNVRIYMLGFRPDPFGFYNAADFVLLPSLGEGCPNVVLEAFACAKPVVATAVGGVPDLVEPGRTGLLVRPKDVEGLASAISEMAEDPHLARKMGLNARRYAEEALRWPIILRRVLRFYEEVLSSGGP